MMNNRRVIILFLKFPEPGRVKTRLARALGEEGAAQVYRRMVCHQVGWLRHAEADEIRVCFDPPEKLVETREWFESMWREVDGKSGNPGPRLVFVPQCSGDLGDRLEHAFAQVFVDSDQGVSAVALGSDCVEIDEKTIRSSWEELEGNQVVFGPTADGGYYLVAMKALFPSLFANIPWSSESTLEASLEQARKSGLTVGLLKERHDVDTIEDWQRARDRGFPEGRLPSGEGNSG